jgi:chromosomal replication initiator protein
MNAWEQIKQILAAKLPAGAYRNWLARTNFSRQQEKRLWVTVPNEATQEWLQTEYYECIQNAIQELRLPVSEIIYETALAAAGNGHSSSPSSYNLFASESPFASPDTELNDRYTFETFVVGSCNQFAHAAARSIVEKPAHSYNPLFVYGGSGMGKTHLIHAIGHDLLKRYPGMRIIYTTSERFMNQMIHCFKTDRISAFHQYYRSADVLLMDDIQILASRERTQEEFFHTFNELYDRHKQIVVSSDLPPKATAGLTERLRTRFEWGLLVDLQPPDLETKMAILDRKAESCGLVLPEEVRVFIATRTRANVRELEGALIKLMAFTSVTDSPITIDMARQALRHLTTGNERRVTIESVVKAVAERFNMQPSQLKQKSNAKHIVRPRQIAMYLVKELTSASLPEIGRAFGGKHHTTVLHSIQAIEKLRQRDPEINRILHSISDTFQ